MAISSLNMYNSIRITGLSSGMDTDSMVQDMMQIEQLKLDDIYKDQTREEWKYESYEEINDMLEDFRSKYMSALSDTNMWSTSAYKTYETNLMSNSYFSAKATSTAFDSEFTVVAATKATYATLSSDSAISRSQAIGNAGMNSKETLTATQTGLAAGQKLSEIGLTEDTLSFSINGSTFAFDSDEILQDVMDEVNAKSDTTNVKMSISDAGQVVFENVKAENAEINFYSLSGEDVFGMTSAVSTRESVIAADLSTKLGDLAGASGMFEDGSDTATIMVNSKSIVLNKDDSIQAAMDKINAVEGVEMTYNAAEDRFSITSDTGSLRISNVDGNFFNADGPIGMNENSVGLQTYDTVERAAEKMGAELNAQGKLAFTINGQDFEFDADTSIQDMMNEVNANSEAGVVMSYSQINDKFTIRSATTGANSSVAISGDAFTSSDASKPSFFGISATSATGTDSSITFDINGTKEVIYGDSNTFVLDGVEFSVTQSFNSDPAAGEEAVGEAISFAVSQSTDGVVEKMESFVEDYNKIIETLNNLINEEKDYDYDVLTLEERESLTEEEVDQMDEKARAGTLRNDDYITSLLYEMRGFLYQEVGDTGYTPSDIGLSTGSYDTNGQIEFDAEKFEEALQSNPEIVSQVMAGTVNTSSGDIDIENSGLMSRLFEGMTSYESNMKTVVMESSKDRIDEYEEAYEDMVLEMYETQERYYAQFTTMETLMSEYESQSNWLTQQLSSM